MASSKDMHEVGFDLSACRRISHSSFEQLERNGCRAREGDVLVTKDGANYLKYVFVHREDLEMVLLSSIAILRPGVNLDSHFLAMTLKQPEVKNALRNYVTGAAIPRIVIADFKRFEIVVPPIVLQKAWSAVVSPMVQMCWTLIDKNNNLRRTRDLLLPRLMSGKIQLKDVEPAA